MRSFLFISRHDSVRSQIAAGLARRMFGPAVRVRSAGVAPTWVDPVAVEVMREVGIDISDQEVTPLTRIAADEIDVVVSLAEPELVPDRFGRCELLDWRLPSTRRSDGTDAALARHIRNDLVRRLTILGRVLE